MAIFERHYSLDEANALLPGLRRRLVRLHRLDAEMAESRDLNADRLADLTPDVGGPALSAHFALWLRWRLTLEEILRTGVQIKDLERGLIDFPHLLPGGEEVYLCWEMSEPRVEYWHRLDAGYAGRRPLGEPASDLTGPDER